MNELYNLYEKYKNECFDRHEEAFSFKRWLAEMYNPPPKCSKCRQAKKFLLDRMK